MEELFPALFQPSPALATCLEALAAGMSVLDRMCAPLENKTSRTLLGSWGSCQVLLNLSQGKQGFDLGKLKGLGRVSSLKQARKVCESSPSSHAR